MGHSLRTATFRKKPEADMDRTKLSRAPTQITNLSKCILGFVVVALVLAMGRTGLRGLRHTRRKASGMSALRGSSRLHSGQMMPNWIVPLRFCADLAGI
jgi:hypothetical protein